MYCLRICLKVLLTDARSYSKSCSSIVSRCFRTSPASSLCVEANEPPLQLRRKKLSLQYTLMLSANLSKPANKTVINSNFKTLFDRKPNQIPSLGFRTSSDLEKIGFKKKTVSLSTVCNTPPWLLERPATNFSLHSSDKGNTPPDIFKSRFYELCNQFNNYYHIFTDGSKVGDKVAAAVVHKHNCKSVRDYQTILVSSERNYMPLF